MTRYNYISPKRITKIQDSIFTCEDVIPNTVCKELITIGESMLKPAKTIGKKSSFRTNKLSWISPENIPP